MRYYIYKVTNLVNGKIYIGQSKCPAARWSRHKSDARLHRNSGHLYHAIRKYGEESFVFEIISYADLLEDADRLETELIHLYYSTDRSFGYNKAPGGQGRRYVSQETRKKLSRAAIGNTNRRGCTTPESTKRMISAALIGNTNRIGVQVTPETRSKISDTLMGRKDSKDTRRKKSQSMTGKNYGASNGMYGKRSPNAKLTMEQVQQIRNEYPKLSMMKLAKKYGVSKKTILNILHNRIYVT